MTNFFSFFAAFEVVSFLLLVIYLKRAYNQYLRTPLNDALKQKEAGFEKLKQDYVVAKQENAQAEQVGEQKKARAQQLLDKIKAWNKFAQTEQDNLKKEQRKAHNRVKKYVEAQFEWIAIDHAYKEVLPEAIGKAEHQLEGRFEKKEAQTKFLEKVLTTFDKECS